MLITNTKQKADGQIESHRKLTERVHAAGGKIAAQIYHAGRETSSAVTGVQPVAPSAVREPSMPETPRELTIPEIHTLVEQFGDCAKRAKAAGFDAVEAHGAHGYLAGAFASPFLTNEVTNMAERSAIVQDLAWRLFGTSKKNAEKTIRCCIGSLL